MIPTMLMAKGRASMPAPMMVLTRLMNEDRKSAFPEEEVAGVVVMFVVVPGDLFPFPHPI